MAGRPPPRIAVRGALGVRRAILSLADRMLPADIAAFYDTVAFADTRALHTFAELGLADDLARGPATAAQLAQRHGLDADALHRVLRFLALRNHLRLDRHGRFRLTRTGRIWLKDDPRSLRPWLLYMMLPSTQAAWGHLTETVRTGEPSFPAVHGRSVWAHFADHPEEERLFAASMRRVTQIDLPFIAAGYPWPAGGTVCDVAGGVGTLLAGVLEANPGVRGVLVDGPGVLAEAEGHLTKAGVRDRVELSPGDIFERIDAKADLYVLKDVLHDWDDERSRAILRTVRAAMAPGSRVVLVENLQEPNAPDEVASLVDLQMLTQCDGGRQRSVAELHALLRDAGLRPGEVRLTGGPALVEGVA
jgi:hypothetical protein